MFCDREGNRRSGVALAMHHRLEWFIQLRAQGLSKGDEHPTNTPHGVWCSLPLQEAKKSAKKQSSGVKPVQSAMHTSVCRNPPVRRYPTMRVQLVFRRPLCLPRRSQTPSGHNTREIRPCWTRSGGRFSRTRHHQRQQASYAPACVNTTLHSSTYVRE